MLVLFVHFLGDETPSSGLERAIVKLSNYGIWGVDLFFVLSGFLITGILLDQRGAPHALRSFYVRRTLRIFPLYYAVLAVLFVVLPATWLAYVPALSTSADQQAVLWTYTANLHLAWKGTWALPYVGHFWSLAVEEHFYLVWPMVVAACARASLLRICLAASLGAFGLRTALSYAGAGDVALVTLTPCRVDALCVGASLAIAVREVGLPAVARTVAPWRIRLPGLVLALSAWHAATGGLLREVVLPARGSLVALSFGALLVASITTAEDGWLSRLLSSRTLRFFGKYSYGIYVFHGIVAYAQQEHALVARTAARLGTHLGAMLVVATVGVSISLLLAIVSYELFEKHVLRLKDILAPPTQGTAPAPSSRQALPALPAPPPRSPPVHSP